MAKPLQWARIAGGAPSKTARLVDHLLNNTEGRDTPAPGTPFYEQTLATEPNAIIELAQQVFDNTLSFSDAIDALTHAYMQHNYTLPLVDAYRERVTDRLVALLDRLEFDADPHASTYAGALNAPVAIVQSDLHPLAAAGLGIERDDILSRHEIAALLAGRRADGAKIAGKTYAVPRDLPPDPRTGKQERLLPIGSVDFSPSPDRSISVAYALAPPAERAQILADHQQAARDAVKYMLDRIAVTRGEQPEPGHAGYLEFTHTTTRAVRRDEIDGVVGFTPTQSEQDKLRGDPHIHTHFIVPNAVFTDSGKVGSLDTNKIPALLKEVNAVYNASYADRLRGHGFDVALDPINGVAVMPVTQSIAAHYSKRADRGEAMAKAWTKAQNQNWDDLAPAQQQARIRQAVQSYSEKPRGSTDDRADFAGWQRQADAAGWRRRDSLTRTGPARAPRTHEQAIRQAYEVAMTQLEPLLEHRAVLTQHDLRTVIFQGLTATGMRDIHDADDVAKLMWTHGVRQQGQMTALTVVQIPDKPSRSITTALHEANERAFTAIVSAAAATRTQAVPPARLREAIAASSLDFKDAHGLAQRRALEHAAEGAQFTAIIGVPGSGKTTLLAPLVAALHRQGVDVRVSSLGWQQTDDLAATARVDTKQSQAYSVLLDGLADGSIKVSRSTKIIVDEWGLIGTRQALELVTAMEKHGFSLLVLGDDKQIGSIEAGSVYALLDRALGRGSIPEILTTKRQQTAREQEIVKLLRDQQPAQAFDLMRQDGKAELVQNGRDGVLARTAEVYAARLAATGKAPAIVAPTNQDAYDIARKVREVRRSQNTLGPDLVSRKATDGERSYTLSLAAGDKVRLFQATRALVNEGDGKNSQKMRKIGRNGTVLEVLHADDRFLQVKTDKGRVGHIKWADLASKSAPDRVFLAYGDVSTIHSAQGRTTDDLILPLLNGSDVISGAAGYSALTRQRHNSYLLVNARADARAVQLSRALNDPRPVTDADIWAHVAENFLNRAKRDSALAVLDEAQKVYRGTVKALAQVVPAWTGADAEIALRQQERQAAHSVEQVNTRQMGIAALHELNRTARQQDVSIER